MVLWDGEVRVMAECLGVATHAAPPSTARFGAHHCNSSGHHCFIGSAHLWPCLAQTFDTMTISFELPVFTPNLVAKAMHLLRLALMGGGLGAVELVRSCYTPITAITSANTIDHRNNVHLIYRDLEYSNGMYLLGTAGRYISAATGLARTQMRSRSEARPQIFTPRALRAGPRT